MKKLKLSITTAIALLLVGCLFFACQKEPMVVKSHINSDNIKVSSQSTLPSAGMANQGKFSCTSMTSEYFDQNVSFFDARIRSVNPHKYVREVVLVDHGQSGNLCERIFFREMRMADDGTGFDQKAGDGVYTSVDLFNHKPAVPFERLNRPKSVMNGPVIDGEFAQQEALKRFSETYEIRPAGDPSADGPKFTVRCKIDFGTTGCNAQQWGWCDSCCFTLHDCEVEVEFSFW